MEPHAREQLVASLAPTKQRIVAALRDGRSTAPDMLSRVGRSDGMTRELEHLRALGLIRPCGAQRPTLYELVPDDEIEAAAVAYRPRKRKHPGGTPRISNLRSLKPGKQSRWDTFYARVLELTHALVYVEEEQMTSWECAAPDEIVRMREGLLELREWCDKVLDMSLMRVEGDGWRDRIEVLRNTNGRTPDEKVLAESIARKLERKLR